LTGKIGVGILPAYRVHVAARMSPQHVTKRRIKMKYLKSNFSRMIAIAVVSAAIGLGAGRAIASQPDMDGALASLQNAQTYLDRVTQNKGGHADKARHLVAAAIEQVQEGIAFGESQGE
jgi:hypothetical protein